jgi:hypothetical protein
MQARHFSALTAPKWSAIGHLSFPMLMVARKLSLPLEAVDWHDRDDRGRFAHQATGMFASRI